MILNNSQISNFIFQNVPMNSCLLNGNKLKNRRITTFIALFFIYYKNNWLRFILGKNIKFIGSIS